MSLSPEAEQSIALWGLLEESCLENQAFLDRVDKSIAQTGMLPPDVLAEYYTVPPSVQCEAMARLDIRREDVQDFMISEALRLRKGEHEDDAVTALSLVESLEEATLLQESGKDEEASAVIEASFDIQRREGAVWSILHLCMVPDRSIPRTSHREAQAAIEGVRDRLAKYREDPAGFTRGQVTQWLDTLATQDVSDEVEERITELLMTYVSDSEEELGDSWMVDHIFGSRPTEASCQERRKFWKGYQAKFFKPPLRFSEKTGQIVVAKEAIDALHHELYSRWFRLMRSQTANASSKPRLQK